MKIANVTTHLLEHRLDVAFESASARFTHRTHLLVEVETACGVVGWGECLGPARVNAAMVASLAPVVIGMNPRETERCWLAMYHTFRDPGQRGVVLAALSGIDIAIWDIAARAAGISVATLLGGRFRDSVPAYATGGFRPIGARRIDAVTQEIADYRAQGLTGAKIKVGFDLAEDIALVKACRAAAGPDMRLMVDANHGYDALDAIAFGRAIAPFDIDWLEEPVLPETLDAYAQVRQAQPVPVAGGETWHGRWAMQQAMTAGAVDILQPDIAGTGGFSEGRRIADLAALCGVRLVPHVWGTGVHLAAALQFLAALAPNPPGPGARDPWLEFDQTPMPFRQQILTEPIEHTSGRVTVPDGPGLGIDIDRDAVAEFTCAE